VTFSLKGHRVVIRVTEKEIDLSGTPAELRSIGQAISDLETGQSQSIPADTAASDAPCDRVLAVFRVVASSGMVLVSIVGSELLAEGSLNGLQALASWFSFPDGERSGAHGHYEWYPGNPNIAAMSRPLVVSVAEPEDEDTTPAIQA
jgi:hypothetical protein